MKGPSINMFPSLISLPFFLLTAFLIDTVNIH